MRDYIKREDAVRWEPDPKSEREDPTGNFDDAYESGYDNKVRQIENLPAADVRENVHGKWIHHEDDWYGDYWECSNCHDEYTVIEGDMYYDFCPGCGAKMERSDDERENDPRAVP